MCVRVCTVYLDIERERGGEREGDLDNIIGINLSLHRHQMRSNYFNYSYNSCVCVLATVWLQISDGNVVMRPLSLSRRSDVSSSRVLSCLVRPFDHPCHRLYRPSYKWL